MVKTGLSGGPILKNHSVGHTDLTEVPNPPETQARYRVEQQFTNGVRSTEIVDMAAFETGVHYMGWTEAVYRSAVTGQAVYRPCRPAGQPHNCREANAAPSASASNLAHMMVG